MARPRKFYVTRLNGRCCIVMGSKDGRKAVAFKSFRTRLEAEEFAAWWDYTMPPYVTDTKERTDENRRP